MPRRYNKVQSLDKALSCICGDEIGNKTESIFAMGGGEGPAEGVQNQLSDQRDLACPGLFGLLPGGGHRFGLGTDDMGRG